MLLLLIIGFHHPHVERVITLLRLLIIYLWMKCTPFSRLSLLPQFIRFKFLLILHHLILHFHIELLLVKFLLFRLLRNFSQEFIFFIFDLLLFFLFCFFQVLEFLLSLRLLFFNPRLSIYRSKLHLFY